MPKSAPIRWSGGMRASTTLTHSKAPRCPVCGQRTRRGIHAKCEGAPHRFETFCDEQIAKRQEEKRKAQLVEMWCDPEAADQRDAIFKRYGEKPDTIKDYWTTSNDGARDA